MEARRVVFVLPDFAGGGAQRVALTLANGLAGAGCETAIVAMSDTGPLAAAVAGDVPVLALGHTRLRRALPDLSRAIRGLKPDAVVSTLGYMNLGILALRRRLGRGVRVIVREANTPSAVLPRKPAGVLMRVAYRVLYRRADAVVAPAGRIAEELTRDLGVPERLIHVVPNPVDVALLRRLADPPQRHPGAGLRFVAAGRLTRQKGFDRLLAWLEQMPADAHLTLLGDGPDEAALHAATRSLGIAARVRFAGFVADPAPLYAGADAFLLPSRWEGMPNVALEALTCGTPVIATPEAGGIADVASDAAPGAVTLAEAGPAFTAAMAAARAQAPDAVRPSLLPEVFALDSVVARYRALIEA